MKSLGLLLLWLPAHVRARKHCGWPPVEHVSVELSVR